MFFLLRANENKPGVFQERGERLGVSTRFTIVSRALAFEYRRYDESDSVFCELT